MSWKDGFTYHLTYLVQLSYLGKHKQLAIFLKQSKIDDVPIVIIECLYNVTYGLKLFDTKIDDLE